MSRGVKRVVVAAPSITAARPLAVPALGQAYDAGTLNDQQLSTLEQFQVGTTLKNQLAVLPVQDQLNAYNQQLKPWQQEALKVAGYAPPAPTVQPDAESADPWSGNIFSDALHVADTAVSKGIQGGGAALSATGTALSFPINQVKAAYRQVSTYDAVPNLFKGGAIVMAAGEIDNALHENPAESGETFFNEGRLKSARDQISNDTMYYYAKQVAEGKSVDTLFSDVGDDPAKIKALTALTESQQFQQAVDLINGAHVSPGRDVASALGMQAGDKGFGTVAGLTDGIYSVGADPLLAIGPAADAVRATKYGLTAAGNVAKVFEQPAVQRYAAGFAEHMSTLSDPAATAAAKGSAMATIRSQYKSYTPLLQQMQRAQVKTADDVRDFLSSGDAFTRILQGRPGVSMPLMPYRTWAGEQARKVMSRANPITGAEALAYRPKYDVTTFYNELTDGGTEATKDTIHSIISSKNSIVGRAATFMSRPAQKVPIGKTIDFAADDSQEQVYRLARYVMPKYWANQTSAAFLDADTQGKYKIMRGLFSTMGEASGATSTAAGKKAWNKYLDDMFGEQGGTHAYAPKVTSTGGDGSVMTETRPDLLPNGQAAPVLSYQHRAFVEIPDFKEMHRLMVQTPMMESVNRGVGGITQVPGQVVGRVITSKGMDWFTHDLWKPGVLLRPALPLRNAGEEMVNYVARKSAREYTKGVLGARVVRDVTQARVLSSTLDDETRAAVAAGDHTAAYTGWLKHRAKVNEKAYKALGYKGPALSNASEEEMGYLRQFVDFGGKKDIDAQIDDSLDYSVSTSGTKSNRRLVPMADKPFDSIPTHGDDGATHLALYASKIANTPDGRLVLENLAARDLAVRELVDWLDHSGSWMKRSSRMITDVGEREWANRVYDTVRSTFTSRDGEVLDDMVQQALDDKLVKPDWVIDNLPAHMRPEFTVGQAGVLIDKDVNPLQKAVNWGYDKAEVLTRKMSRMPTFQAQYVAHRKYMSIAEKDLAGKVGAKAAARTMDENAKQAALTDMLEYVDNPQVRSQAAVILRNVMPFYRAQEEFYTRWAKTGVFNPYAFRKMQLTYQGFQQVGTIHKDSNGDDVFDYPVVGWASQKLTQGLAKIGIASYVPVPMAVGSKIQYLNQGLDPNNILPSFGPGPAIVMGTLRMAYPQLENTERLMFGDLGAGQNPFMNLLPTPIRRVVDSEDWRANSMMSAAAYMEATGQGLPDDATPAQREAYKNKLSAWAGSMSYMRALFGAVLPASPSYQVDQPDSANKLWKAIGANSITDEFWSIVEGTGGNYSAALATWMKLHPDDLPYTVSKTATPSKAIIDENAKVGSFIDSNKQFFEDNKSAAPYWLAGMTGDRSYQTRDLLFRMGLKEAKTFDEYYADIKLAGPLGTYYDNKDQYEQWAANAEAQGVPVETRDQVKANFDAWSEMYKMQNPLLADYVNEGGTRAADRTKILQELEVSLTDPNVPKTASTNAINQLVTSYHQHLAWTAMNQGSDDASIALRQQETAGYANYMAQLAKSDPAAEMVWNMLIRYQ